MRQSIEIPLNSIALGLGFGSDSLAQSLVAEVNQWVRAQSVKEEVLSALSTQGGPLIPFELTPRNRAIAEALLTSHLLSSKKELQTVIHSEHSFASVGLLHARGKKICFRDRGFSDSSKSDYWLAPTARPRTLPPPAIKSCKAALLPSANRFDLELVFNSRAPETFAFLPSRFQVQQLNCDGKLISSREDGLRVLQFSFSRPEQIMRLSTAGLEGAWAKIWVSGRPVLPTFLVRLSAIAKEPVDLPCLFLDDPIPESEWMRADTTTQIGVDPSTVLQLFCELGYSCHLAEKVLATPELDIPLP